MELWNLNPARRAGSETVVNSEAQQIRGEAIIGSGQREAAVRQVEIEPFGLCRPALGEADFDPGTGHPTDAGV